MSSKGVAISEKHSDEKFGEESRIGVPFSFLMRDILQFDGSLQDAIRCVCVCLHACVCAYGNIMCAMRKSVFHCPRRIQEAHRTCSIWLGVGDRNEKTFRLIEYSRSTAKAFSDQNITMIDESRFNRERCNDTCYHHYAMTGRKMN